MATLDPTLFLDSTMTTLLVGPEKRKYVVHKELLRSKLGYFKSGYNTPMVETVKNVFEIEDVPDLAFRSLITWLYTGEVFIDPGNTEALQENFDAEHDQEMESGMACDEWKEEEKPSGHTTTHGTVVNSQGSDDQDYEFDSGSESDDFNGNEDPVQPDDPLPFAGHADEDPEQRLIKKTFPDTNLSDLDAYQLGVLIQLHSTESFMADPSYLSKWKMLLEQKTEEPQNEDNEEVELDVYDCLFDLYILGDRFDAPLLCTTIIDLLESERAAQAEQLHGQPLPTFQSVTKAFDSLPASSQLRRWLLFVFAYHWRPSGDRPDQAAARDLLPRDFLLELMLTAVERIYYTAGAENVDSWRQLYLDHDYAPVDPYDHVWNNRGR